MPYPFRLCSIVLLSSIIMNAHAATKHSLVIAIDGLRGDAIEGSSTPNIDKLIKGTWAAGYKGAYTYYAQTLVDANPNSGPNHVGIMTGVTATKHGVTRNDNVARGNYATYPHYLKILEDANDSLNTAFLFSWGADGKIPSNADYIKLSIHRMPPMLQESYLS